MPDTVPRPAHIPLYRLWNFNTLQGTLSAPQHTHLLGCTECSYVIRICLRSDSFGAVLKAVRAKLAGGRRLLCIV
jgi:hypothetical protein